MRLSIPLAVAVILGVVLGAGVFFRQQRILGTMAVGIDVQVADFYGVRTDADALHYGTIPPESHTKRWISLANQYEVPVSVSIRFAGATAPWMIVQNTTLRIEPRDSANITLILYVPEGTPHGNYTGTAHFYFRQAG